MHSLERFVESRLSLLRHVFEVAEREPRTVRAARERYAFKQAFFYGAMYFVERPPFVSEGALQMARSRGTTDVLWSANWEDQPKFDPGRVVFMLEHVYTGSMCWQAIRDLWSTGRLDGATVTSHLRDNDAVAWILKDEDKRLPPRARGASLTDALECYEKAGVKLLLAPPEVLP